MTLGHKIVEMIASMTKLTIHPQGEVRNGNETERKQRCFTQPPLYTTNQKKRPKDKNKRIRRISTFNFIFLGRKNKQTNKQTEAKQQQQENKHKKKNRNRNRKPTTEEKTNEPLNYQEREIL